ncbi:MAG: sugar transferase [Planctomycetes bacterium]|nr:sugar transferase [Planctomycetota bacterium]
MYKQFGKRLFDILFTILALCVLAPIIGVIALFVRVNLGWPVIFSQKRPGLNEKPFTLIKFRTMTAAYDAQGNVYPDAERLTSFGRFLRTMSLDELPELFNVLRSEMSIVGPRPLLIKYLGLYTPEQARRHKIKPGITGWAQINGRNAIAWEGKFKLDVWYVDHISFWLDIKIIALTLWALLKRKDINQPGQVTMEEFLGTAAKYKE